MQAVSNSFHQKSNSNVRKHKWGVLMSFDKDFNDDRDFFILDTSLMSGGDVITPVGDSPIQFWDFYQYESLADRVIEMSWAREAEFPYSVQSSVASVTLNNYDNYLTPGEPTYTEIATNQSTNPSFETGSGIVEVRRNCYYNPVMEGTATSGTAPGITAYATGTSTGSRSVLATSPRRQLISATSLTGATRRFGVKMNNNSSDPILISAPAGSKIIVSAVFHFDSPYATNVRPVLFVDARNGSSYVANEKVTLDPELSGQRQSVTITAPAGGVTDIIPYVWIEPIADSDTPSVTNSSVSFTRVLIEMTEVELPYFDGSYNTWQSPDLTPSWTGTANASASVLTGERPASFDTSGEAPPTWLSTQGSNSGERFARTFINRPGTVALNIRDNSGLSNQLMTGSMMVRSSFDTSPAARWIQRTQFQTANVGSVQLTANEWTEIRDTRDVQLTEPSLSMIWQDLTNVGGFIDIDNHFVIKGEYDGEYFDGSTNSRILEGRWDGTPGKSTSTLYEKHWDMSPIAGYIAPGRPMKVLAGYEGEPLLQQFVGLTQESPEVDYVERTAQFESLDYLTEIFKLDLHEPIAMSNVRTDEVLSALFEQFGVESYQYDFAVGRNRIPFLYVEAGKNAADVMREVMQAEGGQLWIDEQGIIKFRPRLVTGDEPVATFDESKIVTLNSTGENKIINRVSIRSKIRSIQNPQPIHTGSGETNNPEIGSPIEVPAYSEVVYTIDLDDPLAGYSEPSLGRLSNDSWFLCRTKGGANVSSGVSVVDSHLSFEDLSITFNNTNGFPVEVNAIEVYGEPAKTVDVIDFEAFDQNSIDRYGDQLLEIESDMFGSESNCESLAYTVIDTYSKPDNSIEMSVKGNPALQLNDIIIVETSKISGHFQITKLQNSISASGTEQIISAKRYHPREWFILNVSLLNGEHVLAP